MGRGAKPTTYQFTFEQLAVINNFIPEFEKEVKRVNKSLSKNNADLTTWKTATTAKILDDDAFCDIATSDIPLSEWRAVSFVNLSNVFTLLLLPGYQAEIY
jgi:hypothetical protein